MKKLNLFGNLKNFKNFEFFEVQNRFQRPSDQAEKAAWRLKPSMLTWLVDHQRVNWKCKWKSEANSLFLNNFLFMTLFLFNAEKKVIILWLILPVISYYKWKLPVVRFYMSFRLFLLQSSWIAYLFLHLSRPEYILNTESLFQRFEFSI